MNDNLWPWVAPLLQAQYTDRQRRRIAEIAATYPELLIAPWPKRRSKRRRPPPGVYDLDAEDNG